MAYYLKLDAIKHKERDDLFEYIKAMKMIVNELGAIDNKVIQIAGFTLKCKKVKKWFKTTYSQNWKAYHGNNLQMSL